MRTETVQARASRWLAGVTVVVALLLLALGAPPLRGPAVRAANIAINQCNDVGPGPGGATTEMICLVTVVNTINGSVTGSTVTVTRQCSLDPCAPGNGTFTTSSADLVTEVNQCNGSGNDAAHPILCRVTITNNISADTPGAEPVTDATVNQCVGSGAGGGGTIACSPFPASVTNATVTQCNGSGNGGGGTVACTVDSASTVSPALVTRVNQCNGTGNPGGSIVTCESTITTIITAAATPSATTSASVTTSPTTTTSPSATTPPTGSTPPTIAPPGPRPSTTEAVPQVPRVPSGWVQAGGGSTGGRGNPVLLMLGTFLLVVVGLGTLHRRWATRGRRV